MALIQKWLKGILFLLINSWNHNESLLQLLTRNLESQHSSVSASSWRLSSQPTRWAGGRRCRRPWPRRRRIRASAAVWPRTPRSWRFLRGRSRGCAHETWPPKFQVMDATILMTTERGQEALSPWAEMSTHCRRTGTCLALPKRWISSLCYV